MTRSRKWAFTYYEIDKKQIFDDWEAEYLIVGHEICPTTGREHFQGYVRWKHPRSFEQMIKKLPGAHLECAKGSDKQNADYCSKEKILVEKGEMKEEKKGERKDLKEIKRRLTEGDYIADVAVENCKNYQQLKYAEGLNKYIKRKVTYEKKNVKWFYGEPGCGKTREAIKAFDGDCWISGRNLRWWDGYCGQENIVIDDFRGDYCTLHELLRILDGYNYRVEIKGGSIELKAKNIIITSPSHPIEVYVGNENHKQLMRRIDQVVYFNKDIVLYH